MVMLARWEPATEFTALNSAMDRMFRQFFGSTVLNGESGTPAYALPVDVAETEGGYRVQASLPGFKPDEVEVTASEGVLSIKAAHSEEKTEEKGRYLRREVFSGNYQRRLTLPTDVKAEEITAAFENGVLTVTVPRQPKAEPVKVAIGTGSDS
jgi:HSP20 family protein